MSEAFVEYEQIFTGVGLLFVPGDGTPLPRIEPIEIYGM